MWSSLTTAGGADGAGGGAAPCARGKHAAALHDGHVYVLGGRGGGGAMPLRDFWRYSLGQSQRHRIYFFLTFYYYLYLPTIYR